MDKLNLALIGCGAYGAGYIRELRAHPQARLAAVCDTDAVQAAAAAAATGGEPFARWEDALAMPGLVGAIIATPNYLHARIALAAAERGLHVLSEKPMATTLADAQRMVAACRQAGVLLMVGLSSRYDPAFQAAAELCASGRLGEPLLITNVYHYALQPPQPGRSWHTDPAMMGGGALIQMGLHSIDRVGWLAASPPARVDAQLRKAGGRWADNIALVQITYANDVLGQVEVAGVASAARNELTAHLSGGEIVVERGRLRWYDGEWHEQAQPTDYMQREVQNLVDAIQGNAEPLCSGDVALPGHVVCFTAYRSSAEQRPIRLDGAQTA